MKKFKPNFKSLEELVAFLEETLIPDLKESGTVETAHDFEELIYWLREEDRL